LKIQTLVNLLIYKGIITEDEYNDALGAYVLKRMTALRGVIEKERARQRLMVAQSKILGIDGKPLQ
jgi:hypothetical protein